MQPDRPHTRFPPACLPWQRPAVTGRPFLTSGNLSQMDLRYRRRSESPPEVVSAAAKAGMERIGELDCLADPRICQSTLIPVLPKSRYTPGTTRPPSVPHLTCRAKVPPLRPRSRLK